MWTTAESKANKENARKKQQKWEKQARSLHACGMKKESKTEQVD